MDVPLIVMSVVIGWFGVLSAILGFFAESTKITRRDIHVNAHAEYEYPLSSAFVLALIAAVLLALAQTIAWRAVGGGCCWPGQGASHQSMRRRVVGAAAAAAALSWTVALLAGAFYLEGAAWNAPVTRGRASCRLLADGVFSSAAVLSLAATALGIVSYIMLRATPPSASAPVRPYAPAAVEGAEPRSDGLPPPAASAMAIRQPASPPRRQAEAAVETMTA